MYLGEAVQKARSTLFTLTWRSGCTRQMATSESDPVLPEPLAARMRAEAERACFPLPALSAMFPEMQLATWGCWPFAATEYTRRGSELFLLVRHRAWPDLAAHETSACYRTSGLVLWPEAAIIGVRAKRQLSGDELPSAGGACRAQGDPRSRIWWARRALRALRPRARCSGPQPAKRRCRHRA
jgi:hypothetical protein